VRIDTNELPTLITGRTDRVVKLKVIAVVYPLDDALAAYCAVDGVWRGVVADSTEGWRDLEMEHGTELEAHVNTLLQLIRSELTRD